MFEKCPRSVNSYDFFYIWMFFWYPKWSRRVPSCPVVVVVVLCPSVRRPSRRRRPSYVRPSRRPSKYYLQHVAYHNNKSWQYSRSTFEKTIWGNTMSPPDLGGGYVCQHFARGGAFASFWLKFSPKLANTILYQKYNSKRMTFASFEGRKMLANVPFLKYVFLNLFQTSVLASLDLSRQLLS